MTLDKSYNPHDIETRWYGEWERRGYFAPEDRGDNADAYCIMIPPPNVTGSLHMGHAFQDTIMDALIRFNRMRGRNTLWQPGTDHAGIATQMVVERLVNAEGSTRHDYGREDFINRVWQWKEESGGMITRQLRRMGASPDWAHERFTMDEGLSAAVSEVFVQLFDQGIIYRGKRLVNWDPVLHTALSDLEVLSVEESGHLWHLRYPLADGSGHLTVATTRPETMLGDTAVAVHPGDGRYRELVGGHVDLPLTGRRIPIIADEYVDPDFGSGCVKITPAHDFNDYQVWLRHRDSEVMTSQPHGGLINVFTVDASIRRNVNDDEISEGDLVPPAYVGLTREAARERVVADLGEAGLLEKVDDHKLVIPRGDRSGVVVEPFLTDQWYVDLTREVQEDGRPGGKAVITDPAIEAVRGGRIEFVPANWSKTYYQWLENIEDWCISRQIWWGHRIPAWYDPDGNIYVARDEAAVRENYGLAPDLPLRQDEDVLDTWFSSALWPFSTLGWPERTDRLQTFYPTSVLVTGFDIIFFWVARMIMMGMRFMDDVPFRQVYIHGLVRDAHGQKMSKSKGNVLDPIDLIDGIELDDLVAKRISGMMQPHLAEKIEKQTRRDFPSGIPSFGTDALRFTFAALASTGRDINFDLTRTEGYRNFCNKIWNAARFVLMHTEGRDCGQQGADVELSAADRWIVSCLQRSEQAVTDAIRDYRFDNAAREIYELIWNRYCDWYLELCKPVLGNPASSADQLRGTRRTLVRVLETMMRLAHPIMPFITEEIWQKVAPLAGRTGDTVMLAKYPVPEDDRIDRAAEVEMEWVMQFILGIRQIKGEMNIPPGKRVPVLLQNASAEDLRILKVSQVYLDAVGRVESVAVLPGGAEKPESAMTLLGDMAILIPLEGLIDKGAEITRLKKAIEKLDRDIDRIEAKVNNPGFTSKAPAAVVDRERQKLEEQVHAREELQAQLFRLAS